jgi:protoporphyrinogen oxidase
MANRREGLPRRRFLANLAIAGLAPAVWGADPLAWFQPPRRFTGDDLESAHRLLTKPDDVLASARIERQAGVLDALIVGGGISGLAAAWWLRDRRIAVFEREPEPGGVSKSETWNGLEYALGAAYIIDPDPESEDAREKRGFELLRDLDLRAAGEDLTRDRTRERRLAGDANHCVFTRRRVLRESDVYTPRNTAFFEHVLDSDNYPSVPATDTELTAQLDRVSFQQFLADAALQRKIYGRSVGAISAFGREAIEYYFWGAFGTTAAETSAYHGLNFFAAEYGDILVYPGGNARIARRLAERLGAESAAALHTSACVLRLERDAAAGTWAALVHERGGVRRYETRAVIFASPLFLAPALIPSLPDAQRRAIASLEYRSYVVANVLLARPVDRIFTAAPFRSGYELTPVHGRDAARVPADVASKQSVFSDAVVADFAVGRHGSKSVLTVYRPYPYAAGRTELLDRTYAELDEEVRRAVIDQFGAHGLRGGDIEDIRISRWGHPMIVARPGQLAEGTMARAAEGQAGLFFAHTDVQGAPAYENALAAAMDAVDGVRRQLGG